MSEALKNIVRDVVPNHDGCVMRGFWVLVLALLNPLALSEAKNIFDHLDTIIDEPMHIFIPAVIAILDGAFTASLLTKKSR